MTNQILSLSTLRIELICIMAGKLNIKWQEFNELSKKVKMHVSTNIVKDSKIIRFDYGEGLKKRIKGFEVTCDDLIKPLDEIAKQFLEPIADYLLDNMVG